MVLLFLVVVSAVFKIGLATEVPEIALLHDLNSDLDRRHLDAGLSQELKFLLKRENGDLKLSLRENKRLNHNAEMHELVRESNGKTKMIKKKHIPLVDEKFYHDKSNAGSFSVRCELSIADPCRRQLAGSLHINGRNYDISPVPDNVLNQDMTRYTNQHGTPHYLNEAKTIDKRNISGILHPNSSDAVTDEFNLPPPERLQMAESPILGRMAKTPILNFVELLVLIDSFLYKRYFDVASSTGTLTRDEVAELNIRRDYSLVVNAVSLRYESIEDPELQIFCTVARFLIIKERDTNFNLPEKVQYDTDGWPLTEYGNYLGDLRTWFNSLSDPPNVDAVMVFTGTELISTDENGEISYGVEGVAYLSAACWSTKVSLNEAHGSFFTTALIAAHELGHNLGVSHDSEGTSFPCAKSNNYIMSYLTSFYESTPYKINPWRFSRCSIEAMKKYINGLGGNNCLIEFAYPDDIAAYQEHLSKLPGERHDLDAQCKLIQGKDSKLCESTDMGNICLVMKCLAPDGSCKLYTAARGTTCGTDKWCIDGACVSKESVPSATTCEDRGHVNFSCSTLKNGYYTMFDFCHTWNTSCCKTCKKLMGCWDGTNSQAYTGFVTWTKNGRTCQPWTAQEPHKHQNYHDHLFPLDGSAADAGNTCRDPDNEGKPWCYTTNENIRWEYCDIPICDIDCYRKDAAEQYKGKVSKIADGTHCQAWSEQTPHTHTNKDPTKFPNDESIVAANNLCRDPMGDGRPWCYTVRENERWDWCPVPRCD